MKALKKILFQEYGGFADKRIKNLDKGDKFIVDDRDDSDYGADGKLFSYFCMLFVDVISNEKVTVELVGNIPIGKEVRKWLTKHKYKIESRTRQSFLSINIKKGHQEHLIELADAIKSIVAPGASRYSVKSYKYVCSRTARSLYKLKDVLDKAWVKPLSTELKSLF